MGIRISGFPFGQLVNTPRPRRGSDQFGIAQQVLKMGRPRRDVQVASDNHRVRLLCNEFSEFVELLVANATVCFSCRRQVWTPTRVVPSSNRATTVRSSSLPMRRIEIPERFTAEDGCSKTVICRFDLKIRVFVSQSVKLNTKSGRDFQQHHDVGVFLANQTDNLFVLRVSHVNIPHKSDFASFDNWGVFRE